MFWVVFVTVLGMRLTLIFWIVIEFKFKSLLINNESILLQYIVKLNHLLFLSYDLLMKLLILS